MSIIVNNIKLGFVHIPKNCGTSITRWLLSHRAPLDISDLGLHSTLAELRLPADYRSVAVIRNPWDRMVSFYHFSKHLIDVRRTTNPNAAEVRGIPEPYPDFEQWLEIANGVHYVASKMLPGERQPFWFTPTTPQTVWLHTDPTLLIRYENLDEGFSRLQELVGCDTPLPKLNTTEHKHYTEYYNDRTRAIVAKMFALDIERWNYTF